LIKAWIHQSVLSMLQSDKVQSSEEGKNRLRNAYKEAGLTIEKLAE
jgi:hypothetical protein